ncbi:MAG: hypothetical protein JXL81_06215 [Deltaproteobacteria bacterium]|nr:hypothetical protein [Deltaproteobacteria bacterium]
MIKLENISVATQSFIALLRYTNNQAILTYHVPGKEQPSSIITKDLLKYFLEYCLDTGNKEYSRDDAVIAEARKSLVTEKWSFNSDSFDILTSIKDKRIGCSIYRGIDRMVNNGRMPVYVPQLSLIYDGIEVVKILEGAGIPCSGEAQKVMQYWRENGFSKMMQMKALEKPKRKPEEIKVGYEPILNTKQQEKLVSLDKLNNIKES